MSGTVRVAGSRRVEYKDRYSAASAASAEQPLQLVCDPPLRYKIDLSKLEFLDARLLAEIGSVDGAPVLSRHFETSVPGLLFHRRVRSQQLRADDAIRLRRGLRRQTRHPSSRADALCIKAVAREHLLRAGTVSSPAPPTADIGRRGRVSKLSYLARPRTHTAGQERSVVNDCCPPQQPVQVARCSISSANRSPCERATSVRPSVGRSWRASAYACRASTTRPSDCKATACRTGAR